MTQTLPVDQPSASSPPVITDKHQCLAGPCLEPFQAVRYTTEQLQRQRQQRIRVIEE